MYGGPDLAKEWLLLNNSLRFTGINTPKCLQNLLTYLKLYKVCISVRWLSERHTEYSSVF